MVDFDPAAFEQASGRHPMGVAHGSRFRESEAVDVRFEHGYSGRMSDLTCAVDFFSKGA